MLFEEYNDLLTQELKKVGLCHGFVFTAEGTFYQHFIYVDKGVREYLWGLIKRPIREKVAEIISEPQSIVPFMEGASKAHTVLVEIWNKKYKYQIEEAIATLNALVSQGGKMTYHPKTKLNVLGYV